MLLTAVASTAPKNRTLKETTAARMMLHVCASDSSTGARLIDVPYTCASNSSTGARLMFHIHVHPTQVLEHV